MFKKVFSTSTVLLLAASTSSQSTAEQVEVGATSPPQPQASKELEDLAEELGVGATELEDPAEEFGGLVQELEDLAKDESSTEAFKSPPSAPSKPSLPSQPSAPSNDASYAKSSKSMSKSRKKSNCPDGDMDVFNKLVMARKAAIAFNGLYALGADELFLYSDELGVICDLLDEAGLYVDFLPCDSISDGNGKMEMERAERVDLPLT